MQPSSSLWATRLKQDQYFGKLADTLGVTREFSSRPASVGLRLLPGVERPPARVQSSAPASEVDRFPPQRPATARAGRRIRSGGAAPLAGTESMLWRDHTPEEFRRTENRELFTQLARCEYNRMSCETTLMTPFSVT